MVVQVDTALVIGTTYQYTRCNISSVVACLETVSDLKNKLCFQRNLYYCLYTGITIRTMKKTFT